MKNLIVAELQKSFKRGCFYRLDCILGAENEDDQSDTDLSIKKIVVSFSQLQDFDDLEQLKYCAFQSGVWHIPLSDNPPLILSVDLTLLKLMIPGSIWRNGEMVLVPDAKYGLEINVSKTALTSLSRVSPAFHPQKKNDISLIKLGGSKVNGSSVDVFVPTVEIIRYFYATSNAMVSHLFNTPDAMSTLIKHFDINQMIDAMTLRMDKTLKKSDAKVVAWAATDEQVRKALNLINSSIIKEQVLNPKKSILYPVTDLPFQGAANFQVDGQFLPSNNGNSIFLVTRIKDCDYEHPLKLIELDGFASFSYTPMIKPNNKRAEGGLFQESFKERAQLSLEFTVGERPGRKRLHGKATDIGDLYSGSKELQVKHLNDRRERKILLGKETAYFRKQNHSKIESIRCSTLPESCSAKNTVVGVSLKSENLSVAKDNTPAGKMELVLTVIDSLQSCLPEFKVQFITHQGFSDTLDFYEFSHGYTASNWSVIDGRPRKAIFVKLMFKGFSVYLLEIERKKHEKFALYFLANEIDASSFNEQSFLSRVSSAAGKNLSNKVFKNSFQIYDRVYHSPEDYEDSFKWRIFSKIDEFLALRAA